jgi:protein-disulfide isomerase
MPMTVRFAAVLCLTAPMLLAQTATIGDRSIPREWVVAEAAPKLELLASERRSCLRDVDRKEYEVLERALRTVARRELVTREAAKRGVTTQALLDTVAAEPVTDEEVTAMVDANRARFPDVPAAELAHAAREQLSRRKLDAALNAFYTRLEAEHGVRYAHEPPRIAVDANGPSAGPANAPVTIVQFADFECAACRAFQPVLQRVRREFGDRVRVVYRHFPLEAHPRAVPAAEASMCAGEQGKFWPMHDALFAAQALDAPAIRKAAETAGVQLTPFDRCREAHTFAARIDEDRRAGLRLDLDGTPTTFINGRFVSGAASYETVAAIVQDELQRAGGTKSE